MRQIVAPEKIRQNYAGVKGVRDRFLTVIWSFGSRQAAMATARLAKLFRGIENI
jgi:hypothetical protein